MHDFIKELLRKNFTVRTITSRCKKQGWTVTPEEIETIRNELTLEFESERKKANKEKRTPKDIIKLFNEQETYFSFAKRMGVNIEYTTTTELIATVQKITADIFIRQSIIYLRALELQSEGVNIDASMFVKGYEISLKGLCLAWGIQNLIDVNAAFQCLENKGYLTSNHALSQISEVHTNQEN